MINNFNVNFTEEEAIKRIEIGEGVSCLKYVRNQTPEIVTQSIITEPRSVKYINRSSDFIQEVTSDVVKEDLEKLYSIVAIMYGGDAENIPKNILHYSVHSLLQGLLSNIKTKSLIGSRYIKPELPIPKQSLYISDMSSMLEAIHKNPDNIESYRNMNEEMILTAVEVDPLYIRYLKNPSYALCKKSLKLNGLALQYIKEEQTPELCSIAIANSLDAFKYAQFQSAENTIAAVKYNPTLIFNVIDRSIDNLVNIITVAPLCIDYLFPLELREEVEFLCKPRRVYIKRPLRQTKSQNMDLTQIQPDILSKSSRSINKISEDDGQIDNHDELILIKNTGLKRKNSIKNKIKKFQTKLKNKKVDKNKNKNKDKEEHKDRLEEEPDEEPQEENKNKQENMEETSSENDN